MDDRDWPSANSWAPHHTSESQILVIRTQKCALKKRFPSDSAAHWNVRTASSGWEWQSSPWQCLHWSSGACVMNVPAVTPLASQDREETRALPGPPSNPTWADLRAFPSPRCSSHWKPHLLSHQTSIRIHPHSTVNIILSVREGNWVICF